MIPEELEITAATLAADIPYFFGDYKEADWRDLLDHYHQPQLLHSITEERRLSFGVGASGSGTPFHFHGPGFAEVLHGQKRWFIFDKGTDFQFNRSQSTQQWLATDYLDSDKARPMECVLGRGEVIYFPSHSWHSTLNLGRSVFVSTFVIH